MRKVAVFTGTRAEYGLLFWLLKDLQDDAELELQLIVSGMHLSPEFGYTFQEILDDGFQVDEKIEILLSSDSPVGTAKSIGLGVLGMTDALDRLSPDYLVVLGDRFEALAAAQAAFILRIPILHIHGGEITEGAYDDSIRHAITKLSYLHATSTDEHRARVIQLGEAPERVVNVGAIGLDNFKRSSPMSMQELSEALQFELKQPFALLTYHPVTLAQEDPEECFVALTQALDCFPDLQLIFSYPNADDGGRKIIQLLNDYASKQPGRVLAMASLGSKRYLSAMRHASVVIGNSSSGIIEVPSLGIPTVNIGDRQKGRAAAESVIHCSTSSESIKQAITLALSNSHRLRSKNVVNPYGQGDASRKIIQLLKEKTVDVVKRFHDLKVGK